MTQRALVTKIIDELYAEVSLEHVSECGSSCASCGSSCASRSDTRASALNRISASPGDLVMVRSAAGITAALAYLLLPGAFLLGYLLSSIAGCGENISVFISVGSLLFGAGAAYYIRRSSRRRAALEITGIL